ncbi:hypothetical protein EVAR_41407_1 [Eumeta japonica]|uniref:Uncharacterized protein n=1 Tax=Eumeta variegata TaxID=151549 RepID=A0A4C1W7A3_EUMVA|nr:hypothetical protein EVAR_41407_1 [Eumeta japonica]
MSRPPRNYIIAPRPLGAPAANGRIPTCVNEPEKKAENPDRHSPFHSLRSYWVFGDVPTGTKVHQGIGNAKMLIASTYTTLSSKVAKSFRDGLPCQRFFEFLSRKILKIDLLAMSQLYFEAEEFKKYIDE